MIRARTLTTGMAVAALGLIGFQDPFYEQPTGRLRPHMSKRVAKPYKKHLRQAQRKARKIERMNRKHP